MGNVDFSKLEGATPVEQEDVKPVEQTQALVPVADPGLPAKSEAGLVLGDKVPEFKDIILPRLNIVQGVGTLKDAFPQGAIVHGQSTVLYEPPVLDKNTGNIAKAGTKPLIVTVLGFRPTRYAEKIAGGARGLIVNSEAEVRAAGGTLDYKEWELKQKSGMKRFEPLVDAFIAIEKPGHIEDDGSIFTFPVGDGEKAKLYALSLWGLKGTAYTAACKKVLYTQRAIGCLRAGGYPSYAFAITTRLEKFPGGNSAWVPVLVPFEKSSPDFLEFAKNVLTAPTQDTPDTD